MTIRVLPPFTNTYVPIKPMAPRPASLKGLRPGVFENSKPNAQLLMEAWVEGLREQVSLGEMTVAHRAVSRPPSRDALQLLKDNCDFVLVGTGDCGSCLAWTVRSCVLLEEMGVPTVCCGSDAFIDQFKLEAENCGMPDLQFVYVSHPLGGQSASQVRSKARLSLPLVLAAWNVPVTAQ